MATESTEPLRGEVWLVRFGSGDHGEPGKNRPGVVMTIDELAVGSARDLFIVVPLSATEPGSDLRPTVAGGQSGVDRSSVALPAAARAMSRPRMLRRLGTVSDVSLAQIETALGFVLGLIA